jgi:RNA polymerase sigma factor (sigma-70 family)
MPDPRPEPTPHSPTPSRGALAESLDALTRDAIGGNQGAFDQIHARLGSSLRRLFLQRSGGREDLADDLSQRTWTAVWKAIREGKYHREKSAISTFIYAVGFKMWLQHLRQSGRTSEASVDAEVLDGMGSSSGPEPEVASDLADALQCLRDCLRGGGAGSLNEDERHIVTLAASGVPDRELARRLGIAPSTLNVRKQAAFAKIRRFLAVRGHRGDSGEQRGGGSE